MKKYKVLPNGNLVKVIDNNEVPFCEVCGAIENLHVHHWAPKYLFRNLADEWPTSLLCEHCHTIWHIRVTPNMSKNKSANSEVISTSDANRGKEKSQVFAIAPVLLQIIASAIIVLV